MTYMQRAVVVALVAVLFPISIVSAAFGSNLVQNGDLETASSNASIPQGWSSNKYGSITATFSYPVAGNTSAKAAKVQVTKRSSGDAKWYFTHIPVEAGKVYQFSTDYNSNKATEVTIEYKLKNGSLKYVWLETLPSSSGAWASYTKQFTTPTNAVSMTVMQTLGAVGTLTIDNVAVRKEEAGNPPPPTDTCPNVPGDQTTTPCADQTCVNQGGTWNGSSCTMPPPPQVAKPIISSFTANPSTVVVGSSTLLQWSVTGASSTSIDNGVGTVTGSSKSVSPSQTTTYVLTATNPGGSVTATTSVTVNVPPPPTDTCPNVPGDQTTTPCADQTCVNQGGTWNGSSCTMPPPPASNLIQNGTLETGSTAPQGWVSGKWGNMKAVFTYPATGKDGRGASVKVSSYKSGDAKWSFNPIKVSSNTIYEYKSDYNATVPSVLNIEFKLSNGTYSYQWLATAPATGGAWKSLRAEVTVPRDAVEMTVYQSLDKNGTLTIDNISLVPVTATFAEGMVSLVFDDGLASQYQNARSVLNTAGIKGTFGIITGEIGSGSTYMSWANLTTLKTEGHEIGGHTRTHADLTTLSGAELQSEIKGSFDDLVSHSFTPKTLLYPYGSVNPTVEQVTHDAGYIGARSSYWGLNTPTADKYALYDIRLDQTTTLAAAKAWIDQAAADKRWLVFELHDVLPSGGDEYAISNSLFQGIVDYIKAKGIKTVTLEQGLGLMAP